MFGQLGVIAASPTAYATGRDDGFVNFVNWLTTPGEDSATFSRPHTYPFALSPLERSHGTVASPLSVRGTIVGAETSEGSNVK